MGFSTAFQSVYNHCSLYRKWAAAIYCIRWIYVCYFIHPLQYNSFAKDTSKKIRAVMKAKGKSGKPLTVHPPFGYIKDESDKNHWIVDDEAAKVVKRIFTMCMEGYGPSQTATILTKAKVLTPTAYYHDKGISATHSKPDNPYKWSTQTVSDILERQAILLYD